MKQNYLFKLCATGVVYANLDAAVQNACKRMKMSDPHEHLSKPIVTKTEGGYRVTCITYEGTTRQLRIDVFKPAELTDTHNRYAVIMDKRVRADSKWYPPYFWDNDPDEDDDEDDYGYDEDKEE